MRWPTAVTTCVLLVATSSIGVASDIDVARTLGLFGRWAPDCSKPNSPSNPHVIFFRKDGGVSRAILGPGPTFPIVYIRIIGPNLFEMKELGVNGTEYTIQAIIKGGRLRTMQSVRAVGAQTKTLISNGKDVGRGTASRTLEYCLELVS